MLVAGLAWTASAQEVTETFTLQPGWNAVWLEVQPADNAPAAVFAGLPVASVWTRLERVTSADFIQNVSEESFNRAGWQRWLPPGPQPAFLNNLFAIHAHRAYLLRSTNTAPVAWTVRGRPALRRPAWTPEAWNLRGFPVDPAGPPTFLAFFRPSPAHYNAAAGRLEAMHRLDAATSRWEPVGPNDPVLPGQAYWVFTRGASDYLAPLDVRVELGDGLDFGLELTSLNLRLRNLRPTPGTALLGGGTNFLSRYVFDPALGGQWPSLPPTLPLPLGAGEEQRLRLAVRRQDLPGEVHQAVLEIRDGAGTRFRVPVSAERFVPAGAPRPASVGLRTPADDARALAGLWVGIASIRAVSEAHSASPATPTSAKSELNLRLILHVDAAGRTRLLKEVIQMWRDGTYTTDADGNRVVDRPGEYVLLTDDTLVPRFGGAAMRDGVPVGRRISTIGYDFPAAATNNFLDLAGFFAVGQALTGAVSLPHDHPTNPFLHRYHPDHDNLTARFDGPAVEAYATRRDLRLEFTAAPTDGPAAPDFGYNEMGGHYRETITGIHKHPIHVSGTFRLSRVSLITALNPDPAP